MFSFISPTFWSGIIKELTPPVKFPFDTTAPNIIIPVNIIHDGASTQVNMALDTGASITVLDDDIALALGLNNHEGKSIEIHTASGLAKAYQTKVDEITVLNRTQKHTPLIITDISQTGLDGLLGLSFLKNYNLKINFKDGHLTI